MPKEGDGEENDEEEEEEEEEAVGVKERGAGELGLEVGLETNPTSRDKLILGLERNLGYDKRRKERKNIKKIERNNNRIEE